jgi:hypothetical protein
MAVRGDPQYPVLHTPRQWQSDSKNYVYMRVRQGGFGVLYSGCTGLMQSSRGFNNAMELRKSTGARLLVSKITLYGALL